MSEDPWEPWLSELENAVSSGERPLLGAALENLWRFPFHLHRAGSQEQWNRLFAALVRLLAHDEAELRDLAIHYALIVMGEELGPPFHPHTVEDHGRLIERRTAELLPVLAPLVRSGRLSLLRWTDDLVGVERRAELGPQALYVEWITAVAEGPAQALAARIAYLDDRGDPRFPGMWTSESLVEFLDHDDTLVRAYAARALGRRYLDESEEAGLPLPEFVALLTAKEVERPGIAGPFVSNWYDFGLRDFESRAGVEVEAWFCTLLAQRQHPEPNILPCSNGIDFFAHEVFGGRAELVRKLLDMGHEALAVAAATEVDERIDEMEPLLVELADRADAEVCRQASWHLAYHYRRLHAAGARRGFVARRTLGDRAELFVNLRGWIPEEGHAGHAYAAVLYPRGDEPFDEEDAAACLEAILPVAMRGTLLPFGMPGDDGEPGLYQHGRSASARYGCGAMVQFHGDVEEQRYDRILVLWHGPPGAWHPELPA